MTTSGSHIGEPVQVDKSKDRLTECTLKITNNSVCDADTGNFIFKNSVSGRYVDVDTPPVFSGSAKTVDFTWPYDEPWDLYAGVINGDNCPIYWRWRGDHNGYIVTGAFPNQEVEMNKPD